ncbi:hypothetical protein F383_38270 [Gossypium arboreum]|uniref:Uncharacterized protein n=1 Tax=Gossypium arboreum TaxID=29729 RepID=A0A0B0ME07_GOSAR|nr:hypothetical protein F383_38270 [Gossypium arboreum]
MSEVCESAYLK